MILMAYVKGFHLSGVRIEYAHNWAVTCERVHQAKLENLQFFNPQYRYVNGKRVKIASYQVKPGDVITVSDKAKQMPLVVLALESGERNTPDYINVDSANFVATFTRVPAFADVPYPVQMFPELVVEFYSR